MKEKKSRYFFGFWEIVLLIVLCVFAFVLKKMNKQISGKLKKLKVDSNNHN